MITKFKPKSDFSRNVLTLMTGTTIAQAIPIVFSPILTRIYNPEDFGVFALFVAITSIFSSIATGRYELAIMLPKKDEDAINILALGIIINLLIFLFLYIGIYCFITDIVLLLNNKEIRIWLYFVPIAVLFIGFFNLLNYYNNRKKFYKDISHTTIIKSIVLTSCQLIIGFFKNGEAGLIIGELMSRIFANIKLLKNILKDDKLMKAISYKKVLVLGKKYNNFPKFSVPAILANVLSGNLINIFISTIFNVTSLGFYSLAERILGVPTSLIGKSVSQVYYQEACVEYKKNKSFYKLFLKTVFKLVIIGLLLFGFLYFAIVDIFIYVFGKNWEIAGEYGKILLFLYFCRFIVSPLTITPMVLNKVKIDLYFQFFMLLLIISIFIVVHFLKYNIVDFLIIFSIVYGLYYLGYLLFLTINLRK